VKGRQDKRQVTYLNTCSANEDFIPDQIIFADCTSLVVSKRLEATKLKKWLVSFSNKESLVFNRDHATLY
jgi:hypothetical protein